MEHPTSTGHPLAAVIENRLRNTCRTYRHLAHESLIPLSTLHRKLKTGNFTVAEIARLSVVFDTTPSALLAEAEALPEDAA